MTSEQIDFIQNNDFFKLIQPILFTTDIGQLFFLNGIAYVNNMQGKIHELFQILNYPSLCEKIKFIMDLAKADEFVFPIGSHHQDICMQYLLYRIKQVESKGKDTSLITANKSDKGSIQTPTTLVSSHIKTFEWYVNVCEKISRSNQFYTIVIQDIDHNKAIRFSKGKRIHEEHLGYVSLTSEEFVNNWKCNGFILYDDPKLCIVIDGIREPNVYDIIDQLKEKYELC